MKSDQKRALRTQAASKRNEIHLAIGASAGTILAACGIPVPAGNSSCTVSAFYPFRSEIDTRPLMTRLAGEGWRTCLPIVIAPSEPLIFRRWYPGEPTVPGMWNIPQPPETAELVTPDVMLVPMLAFDRKGYRLGYGGGFYDRTIAKLRREKSLVAIGAAYADQEVDSVPHDIHDQPLDYIVTEKEVITCA